MTDHDFTAMNRLFPALLRNSENPPVGKAQQLIVRECLAQCLGKNASLLKPLLFRDGKLIVYVPSSIWITHVRHRHQTLTNLLAEKGLHISALKTKLEIKTTPPEKEVVIRTYPVKVLNHVEKAQHGVDDEEVKASLQRLSQRIGSSLKAEEP